MVVQPRQRVWRAASSRLMNVLSVLNGGRQGTINFTIVISVFLHRGQTVAFGDAESDTLTCFRPFQTNSTLPIM